MALLLSSFGKRGVYLGLLTRKVDIEDTEYSSKYFAISEFNSLFTAGKNAVSFNGTSLLKDKSQILVECLDSSGDSLYLEQAKSTDAQFTDSAKFVISIHVYNETSNGNGKLVLVGTTAKGETVRWIGNIRIDKTLENTSKVRFYYKPTLEVRSLLYPVIDTTRAEIDFPPPPAVEAATAVATSTSGLRTQDIVITGGGAGYTSAPTVVFDNAGTGGSGAEAYAVIGPTGNISDIIVTNPGTGYRVPPRISLDGGVYTTQATAYVVRLYSPVTSIELKTPGKGYTFIPTVTFVSNVGGTGATAQAIMTVDGDEVESIQLTNGGNGYIDPPDVVFEIPDEPPPPILNQIVSFSSSFVTYAGNPVRDTNKSVIDFRQTDADYRLTMIDSTFRPVLSDDLISQTFPYKAFNTQMEGQSLVLHVTRIQEPFTYNDIPVNITASYVIKKVLDSKTVQLYEPFYYESGKNQFVSTITEGRCFLDYRYILYNTSQDSSKKYETAPDEFVDVKASYAEIIYRNLRCYSGVATRHKLYRKSSFYPGEFEMISNELLGPSEMLFDPVTFNKFYDRLGVFFNQVHISKYWYPSSTDLNLVASTTPINSMRIVASSFDAADGTKYVIAKNDTIGLTNNSVYIPYDSEQYNDLSGPSYNCNFVNLKKDVLYVLSTNITMEKNVTDTEAKVSFYFTSSIPSMANEQNYDPIHGMKLGEITSIDTVAVKYFRDRQYMYFIPANDYYGTVTIVPYHCNVTLSDFSLKVYGDYGFSPDVHVIRIPFPINVANEAFDIKAELLDLNSNVVYSDLHTVQTFDLTGESLYESAQVNPVNSVVKVSQVSLHGGPSVTVIGAPFMPDLTNCNEPVRFVGWHILEGGDEDGKLCYTNVSRLYIDSDDYIVLSEYQSGISVSAKSVAVKYDFTNNLGRKIFIDQFGTKETFP